VLDVGIARGSCQVTFFDGGPSTARAAGANASSVSAEASVAAVAAAARRERVRPGRCVQVM
jgi:hypothetical protein